MLKRRNSLIVGLLLLMGFVNPPVSKVSLVYFKPSSCDRGVPAERVDDIQNWIISQQLIGDTLFLETGFSRNCCLEFKPVVHYSDSVLAINLNEHPGSGCHCTCCFQAQLAIKGIQDTAHLQVQLEGEALQLHGEKYKVYPITYQLDGQDTINYQDRNGWKQGLWKTYDEQGHLLDETTYHNGQDELIKLYNKQGQLISYSDFKEGIYRDWDDQLHLVRELLVNSHRRQLTEYYNNGRKKKECLAEMGKKQACIYWDHQGKVIRK